MSKYPTVRHVITAITISALILLLGAVMLLSYGRLTRKGANSSFLRENPNYSIVDSAPGEGWSGVVYYHFKYKKPESDALYEEIWCFEWADGVWVVTYRSEPKIVE